MIGRLYKMIKHFIHFDYMRLRGHLLNQSFGPKYGGKGEGGRQVPKYLFIPTALPAKSIDRITSALPDVRDDKWKSAR